jgi:HlyD family secretion protein
MAQQETGRGRIWWWLLAGVVLCVGLVFYIQQQRGVVKIHVAEVERADLTSTLPTNGKVEPTQNFEPRAPVTTSVEQVYVHLNQDVKAGQELLKLDDADARKELATGMATQAQAQATLRNMEAGGTSAQLQQQNSEMEGAQSQLRNSQQALESIQKLQAQGAASASEVAAAQHREDAAKMKIADLQTQKKSSYSSSDVAAQRALVTQAQAEVTAAQSVMAGVNVRAPFAGSIYSLSAMPLGAVNAGDILLGEADLKHLLIHAYFDEPEIGRLANGQAVKITWSAKPSMAWHGHIVQAPTSITEYAQTRNVGECLISIDDNHGDLLPNTNVTVTVTLQQRHNVLSLPREALHTDGAKNFVYRVQDGRLAKTQIVPGAVSLTRFEVVSGLNEGDAVALEAINDTELKDGLRVKIQQP